MSDSARRMRVAKAFLLEMSKRGVERLNDPALSYHLALLLRPEGHPAVAESADSVPVGPEPGHAFKPGLGEHASQCDEPTSDGMRVCGYYEDEHRPSEAPYKCGHELRDDIECERKECQRADKCKHGFTHDEAATVSHDCPDRGWFFGAVQRAKEPVVVKCALPGCEEVALPNRGHCSDECFKASLQRTNEASPGTLELADWIAEWFRADSDRSNGVTGDKTGERKVTPIQLVALLRAYAQRSETAVSKALETVALRARMLLMLADEDGIEDLDPTEQRAIRDLQQAIRDLDALPTGSVEPKP